MTLSCPILWRLACRKDKFSALDALMSRGEGRVGSQAVHAVLTGCSGGPAPPISHGPQELPVSQFATGHFGRSEESWQQLPGSHNPVFRKMSSLPPSQSKSHMQPLLPLNPFFKVRCSRFCICARFLNSSLPWLKAALKLAKLGLCQTSNTTMSSI